MVAALLAALLAACAAVAGCQLGFFLVDPEKQQKVKADYGRLGGHKMAIVVWADQSTLDLYPRARYRTGKAVGYYLRKHVADVRLVSAEDVAQLQERSGANWESMTARQLCKRLDCDMVLRLDLLEYTTRASDTRELRKGCVRATVNVYDGSETAVEEAVYETEVVSIYPPASLHGVADMDEGQLLHETVEQFAEAVARKFYDHGVSMRGPSGR